MADYRPMPEPKSAKKSGPLASAALCGFVATTDMNRAKAFYRDTLGLHLVEEQPPFALVFDVNGTMLRVTAVKEFTPDPFTVLGWNVKDIAATAAALRAAGVKFQHYGMPGQDQDGIWTAPGGARIAWFKDPDGNTLSIAQH